MRKKNKEIEVNFIGVCSWLLVGFFFFYDCLLKASPSVVKAELMTSLNIDVAQFGLMIAAYTYVYAFMQLPAGTLVDCLGSRKTILFATMSCTIGSLLFSFTSYFPLLVFARGLIGLGASFAVVTISKITVDFFPERMFATLLSLTVTLGFLGGFVGMNIIDPIMRQLGWENAMLLAAGVGLCLFLAMSITIRDPNQGSEIKLKDELANIKKNLTTVIFNIQSWYAAVYAGLMFVPLSLIVAWGPSYFVEVHSFSNSKAGIYASLVYIGFMFGAPITSFLSDKFNKRKLFLSVFTISSIIVCLPLVFMQLSPMYVAIIFMILGFNTSCFVIAYTVIKENYLGTLVGTAIGFINMLNNLFDATSVSATGKIIQVNSDLDPSYIYHLIFLIIFVCLSLSLLPLKFIKAK